MFRAAGRLALALVPLTLHAQPPRGAILGTVADTGLHAIADAEISLVGTKATVVADDAVRFRILDVAPGEYLIFVRKLGFRPVTGALVVERGDTLRPAFTLEATLTTLGEVRVTERPRSPKMAAFDERRRAGFGEFIDQNQIEKLNFLAVHDVLRTVKSVRVKGSGPFGAIAVSAREPVGRFGGDCAMQVYLDGIPRGNQLGDLPSPKDVAGIEVYGGPATLPVWLPNGAGGRKMCGAILIWTRDGS